MLHKLHKYHSPSIACKMCVWRKLTWLFFCQHLFTLRSFCAHKSYGQHAFSYLTHTLWDSLPKTSWTSKSAPSFKPSLKTHPFHQYNWSVGVCVCECVFVYVKLYSELLLFWKGFLLMCFECFCSGGLDTFWWLYYTLHTWKLYEVLRVVSTNSFFWDRTLCKYSIIVTQHPWQNALHLTAGWHIVSCWNSYFSPFLMASKVLTWMLWLNLSLILFLDWKEIAPAIKLFGRKRVSVPPPPPPSVIGTV